MNGDKNASEQPQGDGGNNGNDRKVSFKLFVFTDRLDVLYMVVGTVGAIASRLSQPLMTLILGNLIHSFGSTNRDHVGALLFLYLALGAGIASFYRDCQCTPQDIEIVQSQTGAIVQQKPEWNVTINKNCPCSVLDASLVCPGFQTVEPIDPSVLQKQGDECLLNGGQPVTQSMNFTYAWDDSYPFKIDPDVKFACS